MKAFKCKFLKKNDCLIKVESILMNVKTVHSKRYMQNPHPGNRESIWSEKQQRTELFESGLWHRHAESHSS